MISANRRECISIGPLCTGAQTLKDIGARRAAYPFDWIFSDLTLVQHCIEDKFVTFLNRDLIIRMGVGSTHTWYSSDNNDRPMFNHHDLTQDDVHAAFSRRAERFMEVYSGEDGAMLFYMTKAKNWTDRGNLLSFCHFVHASSPRSVVVFVFLYPTGANRHEIVKICENGYLCHVHYGDSDNLAAVIEILEKLEKTI